MATGPSMTQEDADFCRGKAKVIAVNNSYALAPWADAMWATDAKWWNWHQGVPSFTSPKWSLEHSAWNNFRAKYPDVQRLRNTGHLGLEHDPSGIRNGRNSGFAAINLAVHYGAAKIVLLGYDMQAHSGKSHFFGDHPHKGPSPYPQFRAAFETLVKRFGIADKGVLRMAEMVHDADLEDGKFQRCECIGINAVLTGWARTSIGDSELLEKGIECFEGLYRAVKK